MTKRRESYIEKKVTEFARRHGWLSYKWTSPNRKGVPDRLYFRSDVILIVEFKAPGGEPTKLQTRVHQHLEKEGFKTHVIDSIETGQQLITRHTA